MVKFTARVKLALRKAKTGKISKSSAAKSLNISRKTLYVLLKGHIIKKTKKDSVARKILGIVVVNPSLGPSKIAQVLKRNGINLSQKSVWLVLKKFNLETSALREDYSFNFAKPSQAKDNNSPVHLRLLPDARKKMIENREPDKFRVSRKTYSKWNKRYQKASGGDLNIIESLSDAYLKGSLHPRGVGSELEAAILSFVASNPEYSSHMIAQKLNTVGNHGVQRVLERNGLSCYGMRKAYALTHAETPVAPAPAAGIFGRIRSVFETFVPNLAPAPPPSPNVLVKTFAISLLSTLLISFTSIWWISVVTNAPSFVASVGMIFALIALGFGMFFFLYSLKYYISLAIVLSRSQNEGLEGNERPTAPGLRSDLDNLKLTKHPFVSVQVALYNEKNVVERLAKAITSFDYPNYEAMLVDDSNDETSDKITTFQKSFLLKGEELKITKGDGWTLTEVGVKEGVTLKHLHRTSREGYKGGALALALTLADKRTEYVSIFDADFVPYTDSLSLFLKYFQLKDDPKTAAVQGYQWHVLNKSENWITRGVRSEYSGSYVIERAGTEIYGGLKQISGSVYMIKKSVLEEIGWGTSITEDFELTLKLYQKGYKVIYTPYIQAPAECVSTLRRLIRQRMRWAEGHSFNIKKMLVSLLASPKLSVPEKFEAVYLAPYYLQATFFLVGTMCWLVAETIFRVRLPFWTELWGWSLVLTNMISLPLLNSVGLFLEESEQKDYSGIPSFIALSYIVVPFQAYAAVKGFLEKEEGPWFRTPKTGKVTDIFTRNKFYRFIQGIMPGGAEGSNQSLSSALSPYLSLATANNRFDRFDIRRQKNRRWLGKAVLSILLIISTTLTSMAPGVSTFISPQEAKAETFSKPLIKPESKFPDGVIAVNPNKSVYSKGENAYLAIAVLDGEGNMVCDADVKLAITDPSGRELTLSTADKSIIVNSECYLFDLNNKQDFETAYKTTEEVGIYKLDLKVVAHGKEKTLQSTFAVVDSQSFDVERNTVTRVYPQKNTPVEIKVKANKNFSGTISDTLPINFVLVNDANSGSLGFSEIKNQDGKKIISWNTKLKKGESKSFWYTYDAPDKSPDYYELGPLKFFDEQKNVVYQESRAWQLAIDATRTWDGGGGVDTNWSTATNWSNDTAPGVGDTAVFDGTSANNSTWDASGAASIANLTVNATYAGTLTLGRDVSVTNQITYNGANFAHGNHKITFSGGANSWTPGSVTYYDIDVNLNAGVGLTISGTTGIIAHNLTLTGSSTSQLYTGTLNVTGDITLTNFMGGNAIININGTGNQTITGSGTDCVGQLPAVTINKASGNLTLSGNISVRNNWTFTSVGTGSLITTSSTVTFCDSGNNGGAGFTVTGTHTLNNVTFVNNNTYVSGWSIGNLTITVNGNLAIKGTGFVRLGIVSGSPILAVKGDITSTNTGTFPAATGSGATAILINGTGNQTVTGSGTEGQGTLPAVTINKASGNLTLASVITVGNNWTFTSVGTGSFITTGSTVAFYDNGGNGYLISGTYTLNNITFVNNNTYGTSGFTISNNTITVNGNLAIKGTGFVRLGIVSGSPILAVKGDITSTNTGTFPAAEVSGATIILINGTGNQTVTGSGTEGQGTLPAVTINKASGNLTLASVITVGNNWIFTSVGTGSLITTNSTVAFYDSRGNGYPINGTFSLNNVTFTNINTYVSAFTITNTITITGTLAIKGTQLVRLITGTLNAQGDITVTNTATWPDATSGGSVTVNINGTGDQTLTGSGTEGQGILPKITINKASGIMTLASIISVNNTWTFTSVGTGSLVTTNSTVAFYDNKGNGYTVTGNHTLNNVTFTNNNTYVGSFSIGASSTLTVTGTLSIKGTQFVRITGSGPTSSYIYAKGDITVTNTFALPSGVSVGGLTIVINGTGNQTFTGSGVEGAGVITAPITINKASGNLTLASIITVIGAWTYTSIGGGGSLITTGSTMAFYDSNGNGYVITGTHTLNNVTLTNVNTYASGFNFTGLTVVGTLAIKGTTFVRFGGAGPLNAQGDITVTNTAVIPAGQTQSGLPITINGTGNQVFTGSGVEGQGVLPGITINKASGDLTLASVITVSPGSGGTWTYTSMGTGTLITTGSTVAFYDSNGSGYIISGTHTLNNVTFNNTSASSVAFSISNTLTVAGTLAIKGSATSRINTGIINAQGDITITNTGTDTTNGGGTGTININGSGDQTLTGSGTADQGPIPNVIVNKSTGILNLVSIITFTGAWTWTAGSLNAGTSTLYWDFAQGTESFTPGNVTYNNINISPAAAVSPYLSGNLILSGTLTNGGHASSTFSTDGTNNYSITTGNLTVSGGTFIANNSTITISGNYTNSATFTKGGSTLIFNGAGASTIEPGASQLNNLTVSTASKALKFSIANSTVISGTLTLNGGDCNTPISLDSSDGTSQFTINATGTKDVSYVKVKNSIATTAITATNSLDSGNNTGWTISGESCMSSSSATASAYSFQRKTWYDGARMWRSFFDGTQIVFWYSTDWGSTWTQNTNATIAVATNDFSIEADLSNAFIAYTNGSDIETRSASSYPGTGFSWGSATVTYNYSPGNTIFNIDHETGDLTQYDSSVTDGGDLSVTGTAALNGSYGLSALINDTNAIYGIKAIDLTGKTAFRSRFYFDPNTLSMPNATEFPILRVIDESTGYRLTTVFLEYTSANGYRLTYASVNDAGSMSWGNYFTITDAPHYIEVYVIRATTNSSANGSSQLFIDGVSKQTLANIDNYDTFVITDQVSVGAVFGIPATTVGTIYIDDIVAKDDDTEIGPLPNSYSYPGITRDSSGNVWVSATRHSGSDYIIDSIKSTSANNISAWGTASVLDTSTNANKYGVIVGRTSGSVYAVWIDNAAIEGKNYNGTAWDASPTSIATGITGLTNNMSAVADSSGNVHLVYIDSSNHVVYQEFTSSWQTAVTLDSNAGNSYATISLNTANGDVYALWVRGNTIYYKKGVSGYTSGSWDAVATAWQTSGTNTWVTSNYSGDGIIIAEWTSGASSPYTAWGAVLIVPELLWILFAMGPLLPLISRVRRRSR